MSSRDLPKRKSWLPGTDISVSGSQLEIRLTDGRLFRRHVDDVLHRSEPDFSRDIDTENSEWLGVPTDIDPTETEDSTDGDPAPPQVPQQRPVLAPRRQSTRDRNPPDRYEPEP